MRRQLTFRVIPHVFFLKIDSGKLCFSKRRALCGAHFSFDPDEGAGRIEFLDEVVLRDTDQRREGFRRGVEIFNFIRNGKHGIDFDTDRQFVSVAVIDDPATWADLQRALLLTFRALPVIGRVDDVQEK